MDLFFRSCLSQPVLRQYLRASFNLSRRWWKEMKDKQLRYQPWEFKYLIKKKLEQLEIIWSDRVGQCEHEKNGIAFYRGNFLKYVKSGATSFQIILSHDNWEVIMQNKLFPIDALIYLHAKYCHMRECPYNLLLI